MGFDHRCKNHPNHLEKHGVCPFCLREKLSRLSSASYRDFPASCSSSQSFSPADYSSPASSSRSASPPPAPRHKRNGSWVMGIVGSSSLMEKLGANYGLKKSRSIAVIPAKFDDDEEVKNRKMKTTTKKKKGFWSKLIGFKGGKSKGGFLTHSTSMRSIIERVNLVS